MIYTIRFSQLAYVDNAVVEVLIIAVVHQKRDPKIWQGRV